ncbi:MAG: T9SS type A sorting domain-containing protein, partial [Flavobacterium sp.]|nr:T9SS type A sorting domain-containing protein [Flavobacterium sp.]
SSTLNEPINIKNLPKGMYVVSVYQGNKKSVKKMIVK